MKSAWLAAAAVLGLVASGSTRAGGNAEQGQAKAAVCAACHGMTGNSVNPEWPSLAGQGEPYIDDQVHAMKSGKRVNPMMSAIITNLSDEDIADIGAFYAAQRNTGLEADAASYKAGEALYRGGDKSRGIQRLAPPVLILHEKLKRSIDPTSTFGRHRIHTEF